jgi:hypothetical protein
VCDVKVHVCRVERRLETVLTHATRCAAGRQLRATGAEVAPLEVQQRPVTCGEGREARRGGRRGGRDGY